MNDPEAHEKVDLAEIIGKKLKNVSRIRNRPLDEILRYFAIERFLYRLSISSHSHKFFLKGGLLLKVWDSMDHRATMDIDLLARTSNQFENLESILTDISLLKGIEDGVMFDCENLRLQEAQIGGEYKGINASFYAQLFKTKIPILIDIGFNDIVVPEPEEIRYPTLLDMPEPKLMGYPVECVMAEKFESIVKLGLINTRIKDFYDLWTLSKNKKIGAQKLQKAIAEVFIHRGTKLEYPIAFTPAFYDAPSTIQRWHTFLARMGKKPMPFKKVILEIDQFLRPIIRP